MNWLDTLKTRTLVRDRKQPIYIQIRDSILESIKSGDLLDGQKLPPDRELAQLLQLDRSTIARAYNELESMSLVSSQVGRGTFVTASLGSAELRGSGVSLRAGAGGGLSQESFAPAKRINWSEKFSRASDLCAGLVVRQPTFGATTSDTISFAAGTPTEEFFPHNEFQDIVTELVHSDRSAQMFGYSPPEGFPELRQEVLRYLSRQGINASDDELLILSGSQQGIDIVARTLIDPNDVVLIENPSYFWAICNFASLSARNVPVPIGPLDADMLDGVMARQRAKLFYLMPSFQNPTGHTIPLQDRHSILSLAQKHQVGLLEDNFVGDLAYEQPVPSLRSLDVEGDTVIYQGTFSKALCPGLRIGWMVAPREIMTRIRLTKRASDLSTNSMAQVIVAEYLRKGLYERHLGEVKREYSGRRDAMVDALKQTLANYVAFDIPAGGMFLWASLPAGYSARELLPYAEREGVTFSPGDTFFVGAARPETFRLTFIQQPIPQIYDGIERLARAIKSYLANRARSPAASRAQEISLI